mmetsp:Transcript_29823/g.87010  ORF Transcript_29823/g.87010 Transcript_29823/m.87010 type:complete len:374 (+) Transcript_29823:103-1224(+)
MSEEDFAAEAAAAAVEAIEAGAAAAAPVPPAVPAAAGTKRKTPRRLCRFPGCTKVVKSQGACQRHGAKPKQCKMENCTKQAQGNFDGMCKRHFNRLNNPRPPPGPEEPPLQPTGQSVYDEIIPASVAWKMPKNKRGTGVGVGAGAGATLWLVCGLVTGLIGRRRGGIRDAGNDDAVVGTADLDVADPVLPHEGDQSILQLEDAATEMVLAEGVDEGEIDLGRVVGVVALGAGGGEGGVGRGGVGVGVGVGGCPGPGGSGGRRLRVGAEAAAFLLIVVVGGGGVVSVVIVLKQALLFSPAYDLEGLDELLLATVRVFLGCVCGDVFLRSHVIHVEVEEDFGFPIETNASCTTCTSRCSWSPARPGRRGRRRWRR